MYFSTKSEYGLRAISRLALHYGKEPYSLGKIAQEERISQAYLERLMAKLVKAKLIKGTKGVNGGYQLRRSPQKINIGEVMVALEGSLAPFACVDGRGKIFKCSLNYCSTRKVWQKLHQEMEKTLKSIKLSDLF